MFNSRTLLSLLVGASAFAVACGATAAEPPAGSPGPDRSEPAPTAAVRASQQPAPTSPPTSVTSRPQESQPAPEQVRFSHGSGQHDGPLNIELFSDDSSIIRYTIDGSDPSSDSALKFDNNITLLESATIRAVALSAGGKASAESSATYTIILHRLDPPRVRIGGDDLNGGVFGAPQTVTFWSGEPGAAVYYTLDSTTPSATNGLVYGDPLTISETLTLRAVNVRPGMIDSEVTSADFRIFGRLVERSGNIDLTGTQELVIEDTMFVHDGNINLSGNAKLVIRNSFVWHFQDFAFQYGVNARDDSGIVIENSAVGSNCNGSFNYSLTDNASLEADTVDIGRGSCNVWVFMGGEVAVEIDNWNFFGGTVCDGSAVQIDNSETLEVEFCFPQDSVIDTSLPTEVDTFSFGPDPANGVEFSLNMQNVTMDGWGINVLPGSDITIRDSDAITIGVIVGRPWTDETVMLDGLEKTRYGEKTWQIGPDASLTLVNTNVYGWEPNVFADNTLVISNSNYTASAVNSGDGRYEISDSTVNLLSANERVTMKVTNTVITGDVIANDSTFIELIDSEVRGTDHGDDGLSGGNVFARRTGTVFLRNTTVAGKTVTQDFGTITVVE